jgi:mannose-6-phosphate isomerase-like protein (cupin superfamily)
MSRARAPARSVPRVRSPLDPWLAGPRARARFRRRVLGRRVAVLPARDPAWRSLHPGVARAVALAREGVPFQIALERRYDRSGDPRRLAVALARGATVYFPQAHQFLPRVARLMVALRRDLLGARAEETSFLFLVQGRGRTGMGLHHDGDVDAFWLQLEGRRTVTLGPPVPPRTPADLDAGRAGGPGWRTLDLAPGTLLYLPPRTPHDVVCHGRSLALSLTWSRRRARGPAVAWDVASGRAEPRPRRDRRWLWTQVPVTAGGLDRARRRFRLVTPEGAAWLPARTRPLAARLADMPAVRTGARAAAPLVALGVLAPEDLPLLLVPDAPRALDGWRFA